MSNNKAELAKFKGLLKNLVKVRKWYVSKEMAETIAEAVVDQIRTRTRLGQGVDKNYGSQKKLKALSKSYKDYRNGRAIFWTQGGSVRAAKGRFTKPKLHSQTTPNKSNLTLSGSMLDNLKGSIKKGLFKTVIRVEGGNRLDKKKILWNAENDRVFMKLSKAEIKKINKLINQEAQKQLKKLKIEL